MPYEAKNHFFCSLMIVRATESVPQKPKSWAEGQEEQASFQLFVAQRREKGNLYLQAGQTVDHLNQIRATLKQLYATPGYSCWWDEDQWASFSA
jgi:hypothetical protein